MERPTRVYWNLADRYVKINRPPVFFVLFRFRPRPEIVKKSANRKYGLDFFDFSA